METFNSYHVIIAASFVVLISYFFSVISKKTNIPSVLMLITLGILIKQGMELFEIPAVNYFPILEIFGIVGLIMIVLEAAIDLELKKEKLPLIIKSFLVASILLGISSLIIALLFREFLQTDIINAFIYAIPLSIMSSAIIIPSVENLSPQKREFLIYESAFSDILGIMFFYLLLGSLEKTGVGEIGLYIAGNILLTLIISALVGYLLIWIFQNIKSEIKLFLLISVLLILYSIGKQLHLSSLIMILFFGLILKNPYIFFIGRLKKLVNPEALNIVYKNFKIVTLESSFVIRTFFFVIFGMSIALGSLFNIKVIFLSILILLVIFLFRLLFIKLFLIKDIFPEALIAPRGLITVLLFYGIPEEFQIREFDPGILLVVIIFTSVIMAFSLIKFGKKNNKNKSTNSELLTSKEDVGKSNGNIMKDTGIDNVADGEGI